MQFAKIVFRTAGAWGLVVLVPLYFLFDFIGKQNPPELNHPEFFYGFIGVALVWQFAFFVIGSDPVRFRPLMIAAVLEKLGYVLTLTVLFLQGRVSLQQLAIGGPDAVLGLLFLAAFLKTPAKTEGAGHQSARG